MRPTAVGSGRAALAELKRAAGAGDPFPLVLLDAVMPDLDGFAVVQEIRHDPALAGAIILMLSSADRGGELARCRELGIAAYLRKPIKQSELLNAVLTALGSLPAEPETAAARPGLPAPGIPPGLRILVAEDNEFNQELVASLLKKWGHAAVLAGDGKAALAAWEREPFDLILMDVQMPEMDGFAATKAIRAKETRREHPRPDRRPHRPRDEGRPRALPGRRHGRLRLQAHPGRGVFRDHRPIARLACRRSERDAGSGGATGSGL